MEYTRKRERPEGVVDDHPTYSRLFVICGKRVDEEELRQKFADFGTIEDFHFPRDHNTGANRGICYIKFTKTSAAAKALESMNMMSMPNTNRPLKVFVSANKSDIQPDNVESYEKYTRLFIYVPKDANEDDVMEYFNQFGHVESVNIQRDKDTLESKGFAYVRFRLFSEAAIAFEECDRKYRPIFAQPKGPVRNERSFDSYRNLHRGPPQYTSSDLLPYMNVQAEGYTKVNYRCNSYLTQYHVQGLFDLIPGLLDFTHFVDLVGNFAKGSATYTNPIAAAYAVHKLNRFEYPPGSKLVVMPDFNNIESNESMIKDIPRVMGNLRSAMNSVRRSATPNFAQLAAAIRQASELIKKATSGLPNPDIVVAEESNYCSVPLPGPKPLADIDSPVAKRLFLVCKPQPPSLKVLRDVFCRFGDLITVYTLPNKIVGYARYASAVSADKAKEALHGAEICGVRIKVLEAEEEDKASHKRKRFD